MQIELDKESALVLLDLLASREEELTRLLKLETPERNALWSLECSLEKVLAEPFSPDYASQLSAARKAMLERGGE